ncbi:Crp/Fnr family transcriptional regulator [Pseudotenacibaculum sp. MALMAid0570]|uniref:Crp/Fnr family transcriptional regulator n=1 Tax=Pseudotenacibaculum sp. MALMAid0570 TaxID=3143938 RepID=UPI0032E02F67
MDVLKSNFPSFLREIIDQKDLEKHIPEIIHSFSFLELEKNQFLVQKGSVCDFFCFIESGVLQHSIDIIEDEKTTYLALKNSCTSALKSFLQKTPSRKNIKALVNSSLWVIRVDSFHSLMKNNPAFYTFYFNLIERQIFLIDDYRIDLLTLTPVERYKKLLQNEPKLLSEVPLHYLASFLGISKRHMSRIRKKTK